VSSHAQTWTRTGTRYLVEQLRGQQHSQPDRLTRRQLEHLRLLAAGLTNEQIATELVLSVHTVERHVDNIYGKIGARSRAEAAAYCVRRGLTSSGFSNDPIAPQCG
jgi:DNA-binding NarL/FixJ family response regulator